MIYMNYLDIEIFAYNMNKFHIYIYSLTIFMHWLDIEIFACKMNEFYIYIYKFIFTHGMHELPRYRDIGLQYA